MRVLVVDDSSYARQRLRQILTRAGHEVIEAASGQEALALLPHARPEAATIDLLMPDMDGLELIRRLRSEAPHLHLVAVSADVQRATMEEALAAGAAALISKTADPQALLDALQAGRPEPVAAMTFSPAELGAFTELMNIAMGQSADALSRLLNRHVRMHVPKVQILRPEEFPALCDEAIGPVGAFIHQSFSGHVTGTAALLFPRSHALALVRLLLQEERDLEVLTPAEHAALLEIGNILLNAVMGQLGDQLQTRLRIGMPQILVNLTCADAADLLEAPSSSPQAALLIVSRLNLEQQHIDVFVLLQMPQATVQTLLHSLID